MSSDENISGINAMVILEVIGKLPEHINEPI